MWRLTAAVLMSATMALVGVMPGPALAQTTPGGVTSPTVPGATPGSAVPGGPPAQVGPAQVGPGGVPGGVPGQPGPGGVPGTVPGGVPGQPAPATACQLAPVFALFRDLVGRERVGECTGSVIRSDVGDLAQATTRGTLALRTFDYVLSFSDGQTTWLYGPRGMETRPSAARLPWEPTVDPRTGQPIDPTIAGRGQPTATPPPAPLVDQPVKAEGNDASTTSPFDLAGGEYTVAWEAKLPSGRASCYVGSRLRRIEDTGPGSLIFHTTLNTSHDRSVGGESRLFAVPPGRYMVEVMTTGCSWRLEITPRR